ncbi:MAG: PKD domain-containing protein [Bacteroidetes bacterium]|nr:PKD domain-containing protein [Bacteroidota bacterium]
MKKILLIAWIVLCNGISSFAQNLIQMPLPAQTTTYTGNVRGYWFTSPTCFTITGLEVPTDASGGLQNIAVLRLDSLPPAIANATNNFTVLYLTQNDSSQGMIPVNIQVGPGDIIGILGNRSDINSYGPGVFASSINGFPVTLSRFGMQYELSTIAPQEVWSTGTGSISRVFMYYDTTFAFNVTQSWQGGTSYSFSNGTGPTSTSVWDYGDGSPLDTSFNPTHTFPSPGNYTVCSYITGTCVSDTVCTTVIICPAPALADYSFTTTYPTVDFTDVSQNAASWSWDFGDGNTSTLQNPSHSYATFGLYNVCLTVTDTCGGQHTKCESISVCPPFLPVSLGSDVTACASTVISLPGYSTYSWSNGATTAQITVNSGGEYSVVVSDAAGCSGTDTVNVTINPLPVVSLGNDVSQCGGTVLLDAQNVGNTFLWNNNATTQTINAALSGTYTVTVTDGLGCTNTDDIAVSILPVPSAALGNDQDICQASISLSVVLTPGATYLWNTGSTIAAILINSGGTYWVQVSATNGCTNSDTINVTMNAPSVTYVETQTLLCVNATPITLTPGNPGGGTYSGPGVTGNTFNPTVAGVGNKNIIYAFTDTAGCIGRDTSVITVDACAGIGEVSEIGLAIYPNPGSGIFRIDVNSSVNLLTIQDVYGREVHRTIPSTSQLLLDLSNEAEGMYLLTAWKEGKVYSLPFIIKK